MDVDLNRSFKKKAWTLFTIMIMTTTVYMASAIWSPAVTIGAEHFGVSELVSTLGITTFGRSQAFDREAAKADD
jgi:hypothetical protein